MALPKKGARRIMVGGVAYRWLIRRSPQYCFDDHEKGEIRVAIEREDGAGATLLVKSGRLRARDWLDSRTEPVRPADVAGWIEEATEAGWRPAAPGPTFELTAAARRDGA